MVKQENAELKRQLAASKAEVEEEKKNVRNQVMGHY